jgi:hypothetical protein
MTIQNTKGAHAKPEPNTKHTYDCNVVGTQYLEGLETYRMIEQQ